MIHDPSDGETEYPPVTDDIGSVHSTINAALVPDEDQPIKTLEIETFVGESGVIHSSPPPMMKKKKRHPSADLWE